MTVNMVSGDQQFVGHANTNGKYLVTKPEDQGV